MKFAGTLLLLLCGGWLAGCCHTRADKQPAPAVRQSDLGWGIGCLSVASAREQPDHKAEMAKQILMGEAVRLLGVSTNGRWYHVESADGYLCWLEAGTFARVNQDELERWNQSRLLIVTALEESVFSRPSRDSEPVCDLVIADLVKCGAQQGDWYAIELPDGKTGFIEKHVAAAFAEWKQRRRPTAQNVERTARQLLGRPYLWGGNSPKGLDCSGFTQLVFYLNGISLARNARDQAKEGRDVPVDPEFKQLKSGDLLFFGRPARGSQPERVLHVGIYLGNKEFVQSSGRVQISSLDPQAPNRDLHRIRSLMRARRVLTE